MFSRPKLGVNTAVYGQIPFDEIITNIIELDVDGAVVKLSPTVTLSSLHKLAQLNLLGIELATYQLGQLTDNFEAICQANESSLIILPTPLQTEPITVKQAGQYVEDVQQLADTAVAYEQSIVVSVVNRYESNLLNTMAQAENFLSQLDRPNVKLQLSTFDLHFEEQDGAGQLDRLGEKLALLKMSDSNQGAIGEGNIKLAAYLWAIQELAHEPPILLDVKRPLVSPFSADQKEESIQTLLKKSRSWF